MGSISLFEGMSSGGGSGGGALRFCDGRVLDGMERCVRGHAFYYLMNRDEAMGAPIYFVSSCS